MSITLRDIFEFIVGSCQTCLFLLSVMLVATRDWNLARSVTVFCYVVLVANWLWDNHRRRIYWWCVDTKDDALVVLKKLYAKARVGQKHITTATSSICKTASHIISSVAETTSHVKVVLADVASVVHANALELAVAIQPAASRTITAIEHFVPQHTSLAINSRDAVIKATKWPQDDPIEDYYYERAVNTLTFLFERMSLEDGPQYFEQLPSSSFGNPIRGLPMWISYRSRFRLKNLPSFASWPTIHSPYFQPLKCLATSGAGQRSAQLWPGMSRNSVNSISGKIQKAHRSKGLIQEYQGVAASAPGPIQAATTSAPGPIQGVATTAHTRLQFGSTLAKPSVKGAATSSPAVFQFCATPPTSPVQGIATSSPAPFQFGATPATSPVQGVATSSPAPFQFGATLTTPSVQGIATSLPAPFQFGATPPTSAVQGIATSVGAPSQ
ncbi:hypothetical protein BGZ92_005132, partial [Podila epicladia]